MSNRLSLRFRDARLGAIGLLLIVLGVMLFRLAASFGGATPPLRKLLSMLSILLLLFPPAILSAVYSLFFEKSKLYGGLNVLLISIVVLLQPLARHWLSFYLPIVCVFTIFCAVVWALKCHAG
jgi:ABC-type spermidine/putrescine transport system permease subunit II